MNMIVILFALFLGGALLTWLADKISAILRDGLFLLTMIAGAVLFFLRIGPDTTMSFSLAGLHLQWGITPTAMVFAYIVMGLGVLAAVYTVPYMKGKERLGYFYFNFLLGIFSMMGILMSRDLVSFFIFWEIMTWSSYFIVVYSGREVQRTGINYILFSAIGAYAMLMAIVMVWSQGHSILIKDMIMNFPFYPVAWKVWLPLLFLTAFAVKAALMPLHVWAPGAYSRSPMAYTSIFSGALSKMGIYGMILIFVSVIDVLPQGTVIRSVFAWLGIITAIMATLWAIAQDDARKLLAYSSIGQLGYIVAGIAIGTPLAIMSAFFLSILHALFKGSLFMVVGAIEKQTGTTNFTEVTGLIRKMPWTFLTALISIIALAGIPPVGGFLGKWMLYESMITSDHYLLVIATFFASTAAFMYCYKFLFGFFMGQEEKEWEHVKEAPAGMVIPALLLALTTFVLGVFPGIAIKPIDLAMQSFGFAGGEGHYWQMSTLFNDWGNTVAMRPLTWTIIAIFVIFAVFLTLYSFRGTRYVGTKDISTSGEIPLEEENLTFKENFFQPFLRAVGPLMKRRIITYYRQIGSSTEAFADYLRRVYSGNGQSYAIYVIVFLVILLLFKDKLFG